MSDQNPNLGQLFGQKIEVIGIDPGNGEENSSLVLVLTDAEKTSFYCLPLEPYSVEKLNKLINSKGQAITGLLSSLNLSRPLNKTEENLVVKKSLGSLIAAKEIPLYFRHYSLPEESYRNDLLTFPILPANSFNAAHILRDFSFFMDGYVDEFKRLKNALTTSELNAYTWKLYDILFVDFASENTDRFMVLQSLTVKPVEEFVKSGLKEGIEYTTLEQRCFGFIWLQKSLICGEADRLKDYPRGSAVWLAFDAIVRKCETLYLTAVLNYKEKKHVDQQ